MGAYEDLILESVDAVLPAGSSMRVTTLTLLVAKRVIPMWLDTSVPMVDVMLLTRLLRSSERFVEVTPGVWARRDDGPEVGVPSRPKRSPAAGAAAAEAPLPEPFTSLDAVGGGGGRVTIAGCDRQRLDDARLVDVLRELTRESEDLGLYDE